MACLLLVKTERNPSFWGVLALAILLSATGARAITLSTDDKGVRVDSGTMGTFVLEYPTLMGEDGTEVRKIVAKEPSGQIATIAYEKGSILHIDASHKNQITYEFVNVSHFVTSWRVGMLIDFSYAQGGKWKTGADPAKPFPLEKPAGPHLFQGAAGLLEITDAQGQNLSFHVPPYSYQELNDNRAWGWSVFDWFFSVPYNPDTKIYTITLGPGADLASSQKEIPLIDPLGQLKAQDWPDKVKSVDELSADVKSEKEYYESLTSPTLDRFGGLPGSKEKLGLQATGFFHVEKKAKWVLVDPDGNAFFHLGVCASAPGDDYTYVAGRAGTYEWLPALESEYKTAYHEGSGSDAFSFYVANLIRKYGKPFDLEEFQARMIDRLRKFGFNSIGAFTPISKATHAATFPYVSSLPLDPYAGHIKYIPGVNQTWDPFDEDNVKQVDLNFAKHLPLNKDEPLLIGYFLTNEPLYEDIPKVVPSLKGTTYACKRALVQLLEQKYKTVDAFNTAWGMSAKSFDELNDTPLPVTTETAFEDMHEYTGLFFETYFKLVADTFHKYDTNHMLIGNRFQPGTINNEQLCRTAGKYLDIMSFNYYTDALDKDFLNRIYGWTGKPMFLSEFYWSSPQQSGLLGGSDVPTEQDRGLAYRGYVEQAASLDYIVGIEWFTLIDQATTGRWFSKYNGERANTGLFSVADRPWKPMLTEMAKTNDHIYDVWLDGAKPYVFDNPRFNPTSANANRSDRMASVPRALGPIKIDGTTQNWPGIPPEVISGKRIVTGSAAAGVEATFKVCWDDANFYVLATVIDPTPLKNSKLGPDLWSGDAVELFLGVEKPDWSGPLLFKDRHIVVGAAGAGQAPFFYDHTPQQFPCETTVVPGSDQKSYTLEAAIPWAALGAKPQVGQELRFDVGVDDSTDGSNRRIQLMWNGTAKNSSDRTHWGHAKLLP